MSADSTRDNIPRVSSCPCECHLESLSIPHCSKCIPWKAISVPEGYEAAAYHLGTCTFEASQIETVNSCIAILKSRAEELRKYYGL